VEGFANEVEDIEIMIGICLGNGNERIIELKKMVKGKIKRKGRSIVKNELSCEEMKI
jgi:hypothetical protein